jgi:UDP-N-acetylglucosamine--N-acetylmuramyl-(pentapeptide) pyrophosphoryl-undecaprenol N-acetylglucosamine transferase
VVELIPDLVAQTDWQVLHVTGEADFETVRRAYRQAGAPAVCLRFTEHMAQALAAADLVVSRAGASTLAELTAVGRPSILLPYPFHRDMHQVANAQVLAKRGAALVCRDLVSGVKTAKVLRGMLLGLMADQAQLHRLAIGARQLGVPEAAESIARSVIVMSQPGVDARAR